MESVPSPAIAATRQPPPTAEQLLDSIAAEGGRIFRLTEAPRVFVLTTEESLAERIIGLGGRPFLPVHLKQDGTSPTSAYRKTRDGILEWDIEIGGIPVSGDETVWQAAGAYHRGTKT